MRWQMPRMVELFRYPQGSLQFGVIRMGIVDSIGKSALSHWRTSLTGLRREKCHGSAI
jgi:hypothetical protein